MRRINTLDNALPQPAKAGKAQDVRTAIPQLVLSSRSDIRGESVDIPHKELLLLHFLAKNYNRVYSRDQLLNKVWSFDYLGDSRTVDVHIKRLREKLKDVSNKWELKTVWGVGYKFEVVQQNDN